MQRGRRHGPSDRVKQAVFPWLTVAGAVGGGFAVLLTWPRLTLLSAVWLALGILVGAGSGILAAAAALLWLDGAPAARWCWEHGGCSAGLWGLPSRRTLPGAVLGRHFFGTVAALGQSFAHPDPATLLGLVAGLAGGTLLWRTVRPLRLWLARLGATAVVVAVCLVLFAFKSELGAPARIFARPRIPA